MDVPTPIPGRVIVVGTVALLGLFIATCVFVALIGYPTIVAIEGDSALARGIKAANRGANENAISEFSNYLEINSEDDRIRERLTRILLDTDYPRSALDHAEKLIEAGDPTYEAVAWALKAGALCDLDRLDEAQLALDKSFVAEPGLVDALVTQADLAWQQGKYAEVGPVLAEIAALGAAGGSESYEENFNQRILRINERQHRIDVDGESAELWQRQAEAYMGVGDTAAVITSLEHAAEMTTLAEEYSKLLKALRKHQSQ